MMRAKSEKPRIALYSHDTMGLGHVRRNLLLAQEFSRSHLEPNIMLLSGAIEAKSFYMPAGVDCVTLPSLYKEEDGQYRSRRFHMPLDELVSLRRKILRASILAFDPDLLIVDTAPWGAVGELNSTLEQLATDGRTRCVLGVRDVWDEASAISREWANKRNWEAIRRYYHQVWVYGDPTVYDPVHEYQIEKNIASKFRYTGYLSRRADLLTPSVKSCANHGPDLYEFPYILCMMGGGQDGVRLAEAFLEADIPKGHKGLVIVGPHMDQEDLKHLAEGAAKNSRMRLLDFIPEPLSLIRNAESVVSMGGYNAVCEIISSRKRALIVPRIRPRKEQLIRAERLQNLGVLELVNPESLGPEAITKFLLRENEKPQPKISFDLNGLTRALELAESLITEGNSNTRISP